MKVLIITYYWPPAGGPGVQRWLKFVKYFKDFGIDPVVYVPENPTYPIEDATLASDIPEDVVILKHRIFEPYKFAQLFSKKESKTISKGIIAKQEKQSLIQKLMLYIRGNFFIPDARKYWVKPSITYLKKYLSSNEIDVVITTGPPHSVHLIGLGLKQQLNITWIGDFRDPWTTIGYHDKLKLTQKSMLKHKRLEKEVLQSADQIVVTSFQTKKEFNDITETPISVITNGYDEEQVVDESLDTDFTISHIGSLLSGRNPKLFWKALYDLTLENEEFAKCFKLQLIGAVSDDVLETIKEVGLSDFVQLYGYVSHEEAIKLQRKSQILLLIEIDVPETRCIIPGKLFEYMTSKRPLLAIGPKGADIAKLIEETDAGYFYEYHEYDAIKTQLVSFFEQYQNGQLISKVRGIEKYSRRELTKNMAELIKALR
ncbi:glycosyltransferase family 4 protein [Aquimarina acroporae]|uniref:glycosyltransferase family 4 protein n=1 Tax=Aquimarina acroporae TaxID=2937283 RepID=UPI0021D436AE|nr:glycosyltransferase family 4 protein [Aquimarina acroporae]